MKPWIPRSLRIFEGHPELLERVGFFVIENLDAWSAEALVTLSHWPNVDPLDRLVFSQPIYKFRFFVPDLDEYLGTYVNAGQVFAVLSVDWKKMEELQGGHLSADHLYYFPLLNITHETEMYTFAHGSRLS